MAESFSAGWGRRWCGRLRRGRWVANLVAGLLWTLALPGTAAEPRQAIDDKVRQTLEMFARESPGGQALLAKAEAVLVFPDVYKAGFGIGGEYGEGALLIGGDPVAYYSTSGASFGLQLGAQTRSQVILFMTRPALVKFRSSRSWEAGVDGSIAVVEQAADGSIDTLTASAPIIGFVFSNKGLMYNLTLEGNTISPLET